LEDVLATQLRATECDTGGACDVVKVKVAVVAPPFALAVITAVWLDVIDPTAAVNANEEAPDPAKMLLGTVTVELLLERATVRPPLGAAPLSVPVQVEVPAALKLDGAQERAVGVGVATPLTTHAPLGKLAFTTR
jgi:hypothetical protein